MLNRIPCRLLCLLLLLLLISAALCQSTTDDEEHCQILADPSGRLKLCLSSSLDLRYEVDYLLEENKVQHDNDLRMKERALHVDEAIKDLKIRYSELQNAYMNVTLENKVHHEEIKDVKIRNGELHNAYMNVSSKLQDLQALYTNLTHRYEEDISNLAAKIKGKTHLTRRQDLQDVFNRHAPLPRRVR